jgi:chemotaxis protein methyltransferase CheR
MNMDAYERFLLTLIQKLDLDLSGYKRKQMERRINSLMGILGFNNDYDKFVQAMLKDKRIYHRFLEHITINVSEFFRNPSQWEILREKIFPKLLSEEKRLYIWSVGCSTGEEVYSLAMTLTEFFPMQRYSIWATDCDDTVLRKAKEGVYSSKSIKTVPDKYLNKYFIVENKTYHIKDELKKNITFGNHDILKDKFPKQMDFIVCRNVVIYFKEEIKDQLYFKFYDSLRPGGVLFTGCTEQIIQAREIGFETVAAFFYRRPLH